jgi:hypothetical protein
VSIWPTDPPASDLDGYPWDEEEPVEDESANRYVCPICGRRDSCDGIWGCVDEGEASEPPCEVCGGPCCCVVDFAGEVRADASVTDYDGPGWPF